MMKKINTPDFSKIDMNWGFKKNISQTPHGFDYSKERPTLEDAFNNIGASTSHTVEEKHIQREEKVLEHKEKLKEGIEWGRFNIEKEHFLFTHEKEFIRFLEENLV